MKKLLLPFVLMLLPMVACADAVVIDGIYYNLVSKVKQAEVTSNPNKYTGDVDIPPTVVYNGIEYNVTSIGDNAFDWCSGLTSVIIPNSMKAIGSDAFRNCNRLTSVHISDLTEWCNISFVGNSSNPCSSAHHLYLNGKEITDLVIPNSVTSIGNFAFYGCSNLASVAIPNSVTSIGIYAFGYCSGLTSVTIPNSVKYITDLSFYGCSGLTSVTIPNSVTYIGWAAFKGCSNLASVTIPNSVTSIDDSAFKGCSGLTTLMIGSGVKSIYDQAFANCPEITDVYCFADNVPSTNTTAFEGSYPEYATLHVSEGSLESYKNSEPWSKFGTIIGTPKCTTPTISFANNKLTFNCRTTGVEYVSKIADTDIKDYNNSEIPLSATYEISVYATKEGYFDSNVATATLVWTNAIFTDTTPSPGISTSAKSISENVPVLISSHSGNITVNSEADGQKVEAYAVNGQALGASTVQNGQATISTKLEKGNIAIVKIGEEVVKIVMQ